MKELFFIPFLLSTKGEKMDTSIQWQPTDMSTINQPTRNESKTVSTTSIQLLPRNEQRKVLYIRNVSTSATAQLTINFGNNPAVVNAGVVVNKDQHMSDSDSAGYSCYKGEVTGIFNEVAAANNVAMFER